MDGTSLVVTFSEPMDVSAKAPISLTNPIKAPFTVSVGSGDAAVTDPYDDGTGWVWRYTLSGSKAVLYLVYNVAAGQTVTVAYTKPSSGTVRQDVAGNALASFTAQTVTNQSDTTVPTVSTYSPADGSSGAAVGADLVLTFSEAVKKGSGNITIKPSGGTNIVIPVTDGQVSIGTGTNKNKVTINPTNDLSNNTAHAVQIDAGAFKDLADNHYLGISDDTTWNFNVGTVTGQSQATTTEVTLSTSPATVPEGTAVTVTATLSRALPRAVTIPLTVTKGTSEDDDHGTLSAITITGGSLSGSGTITTTSDRDGDDETFTVAVDTANLPSGVSGGSPVSKTVTITDGPDTTAPTVATTDGITVNGATVTLTFNENLAAATGLRGSAFTVKKKGGGILGEVLSSEPTVRGSGAGGGATCPVGEHQQRRRHRGRTLPP